MRNTRRDGFTKIELLVVLAILAALIGILLPALGAARRTTSCVQQSTPLRGIHQGMVMYAQGNSGFFPGRDAEGNVFDAAVEGRLQFLLDRNYFTGEYAVSPAETLTPWTTGPLTSDRYSYALLRIDAGGRLAEWRETLNTQGIVASDRNTGTSASPRSVWTGGTSSGWRGSVLYNDNHVQFAETHVLPTRYGDGAENAADHLFTWSGSDDAMMVHSGE